MLGALAGAALGMLGFSLALQGFLLLQGGFAGRALGWMLLGLLVGLSDFLVNQRTQRALYAALGGLGGGLLGGLLYEGITQVFLAQSGQVQLLLSGMGLVGVGAAIGGGIPLARQAFSRGELHVLAGEQQGLVREVTDSATIGFYDGNDLYLPDAGIAWRHAVVRQTSEGFTLEVLPEAEQPVYIGQHEVRPGSTHALSHNDQLRIGEALVAFVGR
jgi:hypothetical protein